MPMSQRGEAQALDNGSSLADLLSCFLFDPGTVKFRAAVAFVTLNGLVRLGTCEGGALRGLIDRGGSASIVAGIDAITTGDALSEMARLGRDTGNRFTARAFRSDRWLFHPKVYIFDRRDGTSAVVTGSNNITSGGLADNVEVYAVLDGLEHKEMISWNRLWKQISDHDNIVSITDKLINELRKNEGHQRTLRRKVQIEAAEGRLDISQERTILVRYVPRAGDRTSQMHLTKEIAKQFFEMSSNLGGRIALHQVRPGEMLGSPEDRKLVYSNTNKNFKIEIGGLSGVEYDLEHRPVVVIERIGPCTYRYVVLLFGNDGYNDLATTLDSLPRSRSLPYWITDVDSLLGVWSEYPH